MDCTRRPILLTFDFGPCCIERILVLSQASLNSKQSQYSLHANPCCFHLPIFHATKMLSHKSVSCSYAARAPAMARVPLKRPQLRKSPVASAQSGTGVGLSTDVQEYLDGMVNKDKVVAFIKGTKQFPQCGFSNTVVQVGWLSNACAAGPVLEALAHQASCILSPC